MQRLRNFVVVSILAILLAIPIGVTNAAPLRACTGSGCNNIDPQGSGCTAITSNNNQYYGSSSGTMWVELRYSSNCNSNWTRVTNSYPGVVRKLDAHLQNSNYVDLGSTRYTSSSYSQIWSLMYDGTGTRCAYGRQGLVGGSYDVTADPRPCG